MVLTLGLLTACGDAIVEPPTDVPEPKGAAAPLAPAPAASRTLRMSRVDDEWASLAQNQIPGFAGFYVRPDGRAVVMATNEGSRAAAEGYARARLSGGRVAVSGYEFQVVKYDAAQLSRWHDTLLPLLGSSLVMTDLDEARNRLYLGLAPEASRSALAEAMNLRQVPEDAYVVEVLTRPEPDQSLTDPVRPTVAGLLLSGCSIGFNTQYSGSRALVTASHCSNQPNSSGPDGTIFYQPGLQNPAGYEVADENLTVGYVYFAAAGRGFWCGSPGCRFSDSQITQYYDSVSSKQGYIARTTWYSSAASPGSVVINGGDPDFQIYDKLPFSSAFVGLPISEMGATTGWTRGTIQRTCINISLTTGNYVCQHERSYFRQPGDSGGPVFVDGGGNPPPPNLGVQFVGTHVAPAAGNPNHGVFSTIQGIEDDFGLTLKVCDWGSSC